VMLRGAVSASVAHDTPGRVLSFSKCACQGECMSGRTGRPSKGDRVVLYSRPHREVRAAVEASAARAGYDTISDYVAAVLAQHEGLAALAPAPNKHPDQKELPLAASA
jgi:hypothetical protein